jgi:hypothetical protein
MSARKSEPAPMRGGFVLGEGPIDFVEDRHWISV